MLQHVSCGAPPQHDCASILRMRVVMATAPRGRDPDFSCDDHVDCADNRLYEVPAKKFCFDTSEAFNSWEMLEVVVLNNPRCCQI
jgi:hypothetical protein